MDSVTDICKFHFLCFVTIIQVKVISGHQVKRSNKTIRDLELQYMFYVRFSQRTRKMTLLHFLKRQKSVKNKIRKITVKSRNDVKSACFWHVLRYISAIFEDIDLKSCTRIHETLASDICYVFLKILIWGKISTIFLKFFEIFKIFENPR